MNILEWIGTIFYTALMSPMVVWSYVKVFQLRKERLQEWWKAQQYSE